MKYRNEIDGLRALSVLGVILFHFDLLSVSGGFLGVDVFFVISGYLISSLLFAEIDSTGTLSISQFYLRRTRRILPALLVFCAASYLLFAGFTGQWQLLFPNYGESLLATLFSVSNIFFWLHAGYFSVDAWAEPLLHTWSLGVEEQFYVVIPLLLFVVARFQRDRGKYRFWPIIFGLALASFALCRWGRDLVGGDFIFYMLPTRMWELLIGVLVALLLRSHPILDTRKTLLCNVMALLGVGLMIFGFVTYEETTRIAEKALVITGAAALFLIFANERTVVGKLFSTAPFRFGGKVSYSWYLWHWPLTTLGVLVPVKYPGVDGVGLKVGLVAISLVMAYLSWKYVETPFRRKKTWASCVKPIAPVFATLVLLGAASSYNLLGASPYTFTHDLTRGGTMSEPAGLAEHVIGPSDRKPSYILMGNSHAEAVLPAFEAFSREYGVSGVFVWDGVLPFLHMRMADLPAVPDVAVQNFYDYVEENDIRDIWVVARFDHIWEHAANNRMLYQGKRLDVRDVPAVFLDEMTGFLTRLAATGRNIWIMEQVPRAEVNPTIALRIKPSYSEPRKESLHNELLRKAVARVGSDRVHLVDPVRYFLDGDRLVFHSGTSILFYDDDHLSVEGAMHIKDVFRPFFENGRDRS